MVLRFFEEDKTIESNDMNGLFTFRLYNSVLVFSKNENFIKLCEDINEFLIKLKGVYHMYSSNGETIDIFNDSYEDFFIFNSVIEDISFSRILFLKTGMYWKIYNAQTRSFISNKEIRIEDSQVNLLKNDPYIYEISIKDKYNKDIKLDLISAKII